MASRGRRRARSDKHAGPAGVVPDELLAAGALPSPEEAFDALLGAFTPLTDPDCDPLTAELTGYEFLATLRVAGDGTDLSAVLHGMIESAERVGGTEALAM